MIQDSNLQNSIEGFIDSQAVCRGLDERTAKAYRLDLELFFRWLQSVEEKDRDNRDHKNGLVYAPPQYGWEGKMEEYLNYLSREKERRFSTVCRKHLVFGYYLSYLKAEGVIKGNRELALPKQLKKASVDTFLTKGEVDAFFQAIDREYTELDSDFRRRVCLRDQVMMKLLFYHRIEISELLRMEVLDYNRKTAVLAIRRKKEKGCSVYLYSRDLQKQMGQWLDEHGYFEHGGIYDSRMFLSKLGKPLSMKMVTNIFDKYRVLAGIEKECTPKDLKNSLRRYGEEMVRERG